MRRWQTRTNLWRKEWIGWEIPVDILQDTCSSVVRPPHSGLSRLSSTLCFDAFSSVLTSPTGTNHRGSLCTPARECTVPFLSSSTGALIRSDMCKIAWSSGQFYTWSCEITSNTVNVRTVRSVHYGNPVSPGTVSDVHSPTVYLKKLYDCMHTTYKDD